MSVPLSLFPTCHDKGPPGPLAHWPSSWDEKPLGIERDFELTGTAKRRLLRLRPDYQDEVGWYPSSRVEYMTVAAREALQMGQCEIAGGFIRDWIIRGDEDKEHNTPHDIDLRLWNDFRVEEFAQNCKNRWGLERDDREKKLGLRTPYGDWFEIDYVFTETFEQGGDHGVDFDVNSFAVSADVGLHKRAYLNRPICKTYGNMIRKVAYLIESNPEDGRRNLMKRRVQKMKDRGWTIIGADDL